jgi:hypothetical protein
MPAKSICESVMTIDTDLILLQYLPNDTDTLSTAHKLQNCMSHSMFAGLISVNIEEHFYLTILSVL